jgi:hypothetical protein
MKLGLIVRTLGTLMLAALPACGPSLSEVARQRGVADLDCSSELVHAYRARGGVYIARGCERWIQYTCLAGGPDGPRCIHESEPRANAEPGS